MPLDRTCVASPYGPENHPVELTCSCSAPCPAILRRDCAQGSPGIQVPPAGLCRGTSSPCDPSHKY
eukprot:5972855-Heterocapsa_arctica.AAC.1